MRAGALADHFDLTKPTLSVHFARLKEAELITVERKGTSLVYHLNASLLEQSVAALLGLKDRHDEEE